MKKVEWSAKQINDIEKNSMVKMAFFPTIKNAFYDAIHKISMICKILTFIKAPSFLTSAGHLNPSISVL